MSKPEKRCIFVKERICPFQGTQVPFKTCQICIEAWKTEVAIKKQQYQSGQLGQSSQPTQPQTGKEITLPTIDENGAAVLNDKLKELDELLKKDEINPLEYIRMRKKQVESLIDGKPKLNIDDIEEPQNNIIPPPRMIRVVAIVKSFLRRQIYTSPENWKLPKALSGKVIDSIFKMSENKIVSEIKLRSGEYKVAGITGERNKIALMILDADEDFESYMGEILRVSEILSKEKNWDKALKQIQN